METKATLAFLQSNEEFSDPLTLPVKFKKAGNYLSKYKIHYDAKTGNIYITFNDFCYKKASIACN